VTFLPPESWGFTFLAGLASLECCHWIFGIASSLMKLSFDLGLETSRNSVYTVCLGAPGSWSGFLFHRLGLCPGLDRGLETSLESQSGCNRSVVVIYLIIVNANTVVIWSFL